MGYNFGIPFVLVANALASDDSYKHAKKAQSRCDSFAVAKWPNVHRKVERSPFVSYYRPLRNRKRKLGKISSSNLIILQQSLPSLGWVGSFARLIGYSYFGLYQCASMVACLRMVLSSCRWVTLTCRDLKSGLWNRLLVYIHGLVWWPIRCSHGFPEYSSRKSASYGCLSDPLKSCHVCMDQQPHFTPGGGGEICCLLVTWGEIKLVGWCKIYIIIEQM